MLDGTCHTVPSCFPKRTDNDQYSLSASCLILTFVTKLSLHMTKKPLNWCFTI